MNKNLVNLEGTEKQVSYAERIRWSLFGGLIDLCENEEKRELFISIINNKTSAEWWIEETNHGRKSAESVFKMCMTAE